MRPALLFDDSYRSILALKADPRWLEAMAKRGITDPDTVQIDPWPTGNFGNPDEEGRRITRCLSYYREDPADNGYARPVEGVLATVDAARGEVLEVLDFGRRAPAPRTRHLPVGRQRPGPRRPPAARDRPARGGELHPRRAPAELAEVVDAPVHASRWRAWSSTRWATTTTARTRPVLHRASISEMVVPYGDPGPMHGWKNAFDVGEWGLGRMANSLTLGCDCLGEITYLDAAFASEHGHVHVVENAICIHEEDYGILWKHNDMNTGHTEVRRSRRLVVSSIATVGNYEYGFYWYFYLDGSLQLEVKLTGIMSTQAVAEGQATPWAAPVAPGLAAPFHQHLFCARLDITVDGPVNEVHEVVLRAGARGSRQPVGQRHAPAGDPPRDRVGRPARRRPGRRAATGGS